MIFNHKPQRQRIRIFENFKGGCFSDFRVVIGLRLDMNFAFFPQEIAKAEKRVEKQRRALVSAAEHPMTDAVVFKKIADLLIIGRRIVRNTRIVIAQTFILVAHRQIFDAIAGLRLKTS